MDVNTSILCTCPLVQYIYIYQYYVYVYHYTIYIYIYICIYIYTDASISFFPLLMSKDILTSLRSNVDIS